jgi:hypothetical protein
LVLWEEAVGLVAEDDVFSFAFTGAVVVAFPDLVPVDRHVVVVGIPTTWEDISIVSFPITVNAQCPVMQMTS